MIVGTYAGRQVSAKNLRRGFAWLVLAMGLFVIARQLSVAVSAVVAVLTMAAVFIVSLGLVHPSRSKTHE